MGVRNYLRGVFNAVRGKRLPVLTAGRVSDDGTGMQAAFDRVWGGQMPVPAKFPLMVYDVMDELFLQQPYLKRFASTTLGLANTGHKLEISAASEKRAMSALKECNDLAARCSPFKGGADGVVNGGIFQCCRTGGTAIEWPPDEAMSMVTRAYLIPVRTCWFRYDEFGEIELCQQQWIGGKQQGPYVPLNMAQTSFSAISTYDESPWPIPPALTALSALKQLSEFTRAVSGWLEKLGALGVFLAEIERPDSFGEDEAEYERKAAAKLDAIAKTLRDHLKKGFAAGYDNIKFKYHQTTSGAAGAKDILQMILQTLFAALEHDPVFFGWIWGSTQTYTTVLFEVLLNIIQTYQNCVRRSLEHGHRLNLSLRGFSDVSLSVRFNEPRSLDSFMHSEAKQMAASAVVQQYESGLIDRDEARRMLGIQDQAAGTDAFVAMFNRASNVYLMLPPKKRWNGMDFARNALPPGRSRKVAMRNAKRDAIRAAREYRTQVTNMLSDAGRTGVQAVYEWALAHDVPDVDEFVALALERFSTSAEGSIDESKLIELAREHLTAIWEFGKKDRALFGGDSSLGVGISFGEPDKAAVSYLAEKVDRFYVSKYVSQSEPRSAQIQNFLREQYLEKGLGRGKSKPELQAFKDEFGDLVEQIGDHAARVIIDTGVSRAQNWANVMALHEAEITEFRIAGPRDSHTCQYCWSMLDRTFSVETEHTRIQEIIDSGDEDISKFHKFITSRFGTQAGLESLRAATDADVQASGMVTPPIHPLCRHRLVAVVHLASSNRRVNVYTPTVAFRWQKAA